MAVWAVLASGLGGLAGGCAGPRQSDLTPLPISPPAFARKWATEIGLRNDTVTNVYVREDLLLVYTKKGICYILKRETGELVRADTIEGGKYRLRAPVVLKEYIVYPTTTLLEVFDRRTGDLVRSIDMGAAIAANITGERNYVYVSLATPQGARMRKVDLAQKVSNLPVWELAPFDGAVLAAPVIHTDVLYMGTDTGKVYAVSTEQREAIWSRAEDSTFDATAPIVADLAADEAGLYVPTVGSGRLYCLNRVSGQVKWQYFASGGLTAAPVPIADTVYQLDPNRGMVAINKLEDPDLKTPQYNRQMGKGVRWTLPNIVKILSQDDDHTYALRNDGIIVALDKKTGETQFAARHNSLAFYGLNNSKDSTIYGATPDGRIVAIRAVFQPGQVGEMVKASDTTGTPQAVAVAEPAAGEIRMTKSE